MDLKAKAMDRAVTLQYGLSSVQNLGFALARQSSAPIEHR